MKVLTSKLHYDAKIFVLKIASRVTQSRRIIQVRNRSIHVCESYLPQSTLVSSPCHAQRHRNANATIICTVQPSPFPNRTAQPTCLLLATGRGEAAKPFLTSSCAGRREGTVSNHHCPSSSDHHQYPDPEPHSDCSLKPTNH